MGGRGGICKSTDSGASSSSSMSSSSALIYGAKGSLYLSGGGGGKGGRRSSLAQGIEECQVVILFLSKEYINKVCENNKKDNVVLEYTMTMNWKAGGSRVRAHRI